MVWTFFCSALAILALIGRCWCRARRGLRGRGVRLGWLCGVVDERLFVADGQHAHLLGREPEREVAGVMFDEEADETLVRAERRAVDAERGLVGVVAVA